MIEIAVKINGKNLKGGIRSNKATIEEISLSISELELLLYEQIEIFKKITHTNSGGFE